MNSTIRRLPRFTRSRLGRTLSLVAGLGLAATAAVACGEDGGGHEEVGTPSGAVCPEGSTLSYANFGKEFMETYCTRCHASDLTGDARNGAPTGHDFDTLAGIKAVAEHVDGLAAKGPDATNTDMPPGDPRPVTAEREMLGEWLACGAL
jgi:uncharacterized membrane protein